MLNPRAKTRRSSARSLQIVPADDLRRNGAWPWRSQIRTSLPQMATQMPPWTTMVYDTDSPLAKRDTDISRHG
jgi:hypothetical protein